MNRKNLSIWLKTIIVCIGICGALIYVLVLPIISDVLQPFASDVSAKYLWLSLLWLSGLPCYAVLIFSWLVCRDIENGRAFSVENAKRLRIISILSGADTIFLLLGNTILFLLEKNNIFTMAFCALIAFLGVAFSVAIAALSHLADRACELQEECDLTI